MVEIADLADDAVSLVEQWLAESKNEPVDTAAKQLAGVLSDPNGLAFTVGFVDQVVRPEDSQVAAHNLKSLLPLTPRFLPPPLRAAIKLGGTMAPSLPNVVVPIARRVLRQMVRHLIVDATDRRLGPAIAKIRGTKGDIRLNINLLGEAILGDKEAERRLKGTMALLKRKDVDYVSIKVSATVAPHSPWAFDEAVNDAVAALRPLYEQAATDRTFINLDMEEYKDLDLTLAVFMRLLDDFPDLEAGIVLQAYLPDALAAMMQLQDWATVRVNNGGKPIKVRVVKGANLPMEQVDAEIHGWPLATWDTKTKTDASYLAVLDYALRPEHTRNVRIGVAGHNLFDVALAWLLAQKRGVTEGVDFEMLLGMATAQAAVVRRTVGSILLYTPVVHPAEFDVAIAYLIRRLEEGASHENFMSAVFDLADDEALFEREKERFLASIDAMPESVPEANRVMDRTVPQPESAQQGFENTPDTDPSIDANRAWADEIRSRMATSTLGNAAIEAATLTSVEEVDETVRRGIAAGDAWRALGADKRAAILHKVADELQARRADLLEVMGSEAGKVIEQGDPEVSEAIDFANYYAERGRDLEHVEGADFHPAALTVVTPPWNFPVAIPAGSTLAALAAGSPVIIKPAPQASRCGAVMVEALWAAGVPRDVLQLVQVDDEGDVGRRLVSHPDVERLILTGAYETAELFRQFRPDLPLLGETSGKNAIIITPSADLDLAAKDVVASAFGHAGQKCSAASLVVLVGSVATSERFRRQLVDATMSLDVGLPWEPGSQVGPLIGPAEGKLQRALTTLEPGQKWLVLPHKVPARDGAADGQLWRPGIREGVVQGSEFHQVEYFGPVLGIMTADTLDEAIDLVNSVDYGLTSGLHALDEDEIARWLRRVEAGNLYVNRGTTGAIVQRQPFGGWRKSAVGTTTKAGGPNYLFGLGDWVDAPIDAGDGETVADSRKSVAWARERAEEVRARATRKRRRDALTTSALVAAEEAGLDEAALSWLAAALQSDVAAVATEFAVAHDPTGLASEANVFRYHPAAVTVRWEGAGSQGGGVEKMMRTVAAGLRVGSPVSVSVSGDVPRSVRGWLADNNVTTHRTDDAAWATEVARLAETGGRIRLVDADPAAVTEASGGSPQLAVYGGDVTSAGRVEILPYVREQAVSITTHRFGTPRTYDVPAVINPRRPLVVG